MTQDKHDNPQAMEHAEAAAREDQPTPGAPGEPGEETHPAAEVDPAVELEAQGGLPEDAAAPDADPLGELRRVHDELNDKYLRLAAEFQNYQRRSQQNVVQAREQQAMSMARDLLTVLDHFDNALGVDPEKTSAEDLLQGVTSIRDELLRALRNHGIERLDADPGEAFDPNHHEALMRQPSDEHESGAVAQQLQPGYRFAGKTLRPVKVAVVE